LTTWAAPRAATVAPDTRCAAIGRRDSEAALFYAPGGGPPLRKSLPISNAGARGRRTQRRYGSAPRSAPPYPRSHRPLVGSLLLRFTLFPVVCSYFRWIFLSPKPLVYARICRRVYCWFGSLQIEQASSVIHGRLIWRDYRAKLSKPVSADSGVRMLIE